MSIELMLNAVNLTFVAFAAELKMLSGHVFVFFVMVVGRCRSRGWTCDHNRRIPHARNAERRSRESFKL